MDRSLLLARHGYLFTAALDEPERRRLHETDAVTIPFLGRRTLLVSGDAGVRLFYDETQIMRHRAVPAPIATSLFGPGAIHGMDDVPHRHRKRLFLEALRQEELDRLTVIARRRWRRELDQWRAAGAGEVYAAAVVAFGSSIIEWAGIDESESAKAEHARWLADIVDGFGVIGPAYVKAALARRRCDRWAARLISQARTDGSAPAGSWLDQVASFVDENGRPLPERTAAVELLNILRPTVAVSWLAAFAALALQEHPDWRARLRSTEAAEQQALADAFAHEVRRYYPFVPVLAGRARQDIEFAGQRLARGQRVLLDVYGTNHGAEWEDPWSFDPGRFLDVDPCDVTHFIPQGGGPRETGHRCPGEGVSNALVAVAASELAGLTPIELPVQDLEYSMRRMPTRPRSGVRLTP
jgi:fatty-acid peroxygenase